MNWEHFDLENVLDQRKKSHDFFSKKNGANFDVTNIYKKNSCQRLETPIK